MNLQLKRVKRVNKYKSVDAYLEALFRKNKTAILENISPEWVASYKGNIKKAFKKLITERMEWYNYKTGKNFTLAQAIKAIENSKALNKTWGQKEVRFQNFQQLLKKDKNIYKAFREELRDEHGRFTKYNAKELEFLGYYGSAEGNAAVYKFRDLVIFEKKSPDKSTGATISAMSKFQFNMAVGKTLQFNSWSNPDPTPSRNRRK